MKYHSNLDCTKAYVQGLCYYGNCANVSFNPNEFYSYKTCIAKKVKGYGGQRVLLVSRDNFSITTSKHIQCIVHSFYCEDNDIDALVYVPFSYEDKDVSLFTLADRFYGALRDYRNFDFNLKSDRQKFSILYHHAKNFSDKVMTLSFLEELWVKMMVDKIRWIEDYKASKISNYTKVYI